MKKGEIRAIRLTKDAAFEIVREFFAENGNRIFKINTESDDILYHFEKDEENGEYVVAASLVDTSIDISNLDLSSIIRIDSAFNNVQYSIISKK